jgi:hypothetical protein
VAPIGPLQAAGFLLASYAVIGNDALQTLGTFLAGNRGRTPKLLQAMFLCAVLCGFLLLGWSLGGGDPAWGRLSSFALPERFGWADLLPPIVVLALTQWGAPVSTSFLVLTAFGPSNLPGLLLQSLAGYGAAFVVGALLYGSLPWLLDPPSGTSEADEPPDSAGRPILWLWLQWTATGWLWGQWLIQDLANIYVYLPRRLTGMEMAASLTVLCAGVGLLVARDGGAIQRVLACKTDSDDPRSSTLITALYGLVLFAFARISTVPMSTTWVFLGLLAGREMGLLLRLGLRPASQVASDLGRDLLRAGLGLVVSVGVALSIPTLKGLG